MKASPNTSHTVVLLDPHNSQPAEIMKVNMLDGKPIWTVLILQTIEHSANMAKLSAAPTAEYRQRGFKGAHWLRRRCCVACGNVIKLKGFDNTILGRHKFWVIIPRLFQR